MGMFSKCKVCGCNITFRTSYCEDHKKQGETDIKAKYNNYNNNNEIRKRRSSGLWIRTKDKVKDRQKGLCYVCALEGRYVAYDDVHHIIPAESNLELFYDLDNVLGLCKGHHRLIHKLNINNIEDINNIHK